MFPTRYYPNRYYAPRYYPKVGSGPVVAGAGTLLPLMNVGSWLLWWCLC